MPALQLSNLSETVLKELESRAASFRRAVEEEASAVLSQAVLNDMRRPDLTAEQLIDRARRVREGHPHAWVTEEFLRMAKDDGRL